MNVIPLNIKELIVEVKDLKHGHDKFVKELQDLYVSCTIDNSLVKKQVGVSMRKTFIQKCDPEFDRKFNEVFTKHVTEIKTVIMNR